MKPFLLSLSLIAALQAHGAELTENFNSLSNIASSTAFVNTALGMVHPTIQIVNYDLAPPAIDVELGDGSDGAFIPSRYAQFSQGGNLAGNIIRLDTSQPLQVTEFHLDNGWFIEPVGNNPLIIYSLTDVIIEGEIRCQGDHGDDAVGATPGAGGIPRCGGLAGGNGGALNQPGGDGGNASGSVTGGEGGNATGAAIGGGGGGSWNTSGAPSNGAGASVINGGLAGNSDYDPDFTTIAGGAGGGGGAGTAANPGGGGGAGGGVVIIHAARDFKLGDNAPSNGFIYVKGGDGGNAVGGRGGGGAGGSVKVFAGGEIEVWNAVASDAGIGMGPGAVGGPGRSWFSSVVYTAQNGGSYSPTEEPTFTFGPGNAEFVGTPQEVVSKVYDLRNTYPTFTSLTSTPVSADFTLEIAGSDDGFVNDDTGWRTTVSDINGKRYVRFRVTITTSNQATPTMLDAVTLSYIPNIQNEFTFEAAGCGQVAGGSPLSGLPMLLLFGFLFALKLVAKKQERIG